ncbi:hypothetical protein EDC96DRAFT_524039 [Choanephora cucurbitarum]|nr:hypothetical protein EDC96DRAFT_524039 [Choanephora cucurbitarum]
MYFLSSFSLTVVIDAFRLDPPWKLLLHKQSTLEKKGYNFLSVKRKLRMICQFKRYLHLQISGAIFGLFPNQIKKTHIYLRHLNNQKFFNMVSMHFDELVMLLTMAGRIRYQPV